METWLVFVIAFWALMLGIVVMRAYFSIHIRRAGERVLPDKEAVKREGRGMFAFRVVAFSVVVIAGLLWRVPKEEQMMVEKFGDEYKIYMKKTGRFFPKLTANASA
jgi:hypothetical protein